MTRIQRGFQTGRILGLNRNDFDLRHQLFDQHRHAGRETATPEQAELFQRGDTLSDCKIALPDEGLLVATICVRNLFEVTSRSGSHFLRIGCEFVNLPASRLTLIQRYITRVERERKARLNGMS